MVPLSWCLIGTKEHRLQQIFTFIPMKFEDLLQCVGDSEGVS